MSKNMGEKELLDRLAALPREISPRRDPWPEISARIARGETALDPAARRHGWWLRAVAAAAVIAVLAGILFNTSGPPAPAGPESASSDAGFSQRVDAFAMQASLASSEAEYLAAFREFIPVGDSRNRLEAATVEKIEQGWSDLKTTEAALALALEDNPNNEFLGNRMLELRARQLGFLKQLATLDMNNRRLTI